nr:MAG TPA: hypothetical protein [Crassvirales sp.]
MSKNKAKNGIVVNAGNGNYIPNIVRGGAAIPIGKKNFYYMQGRKHEQGGIDVGRNAKTGLEVEGEEVMQVTPNEVRVYSSVPFLQGNSPAELVMGGANPDAVFNAQEEFKDRNRINDDGTKYQIGGEKQNRQIGDSPYDDPTFVINKKITLRKKAGRVTGLNIGKNNFNVIRTLSRGLRILSPIAEIVQNVFPNKEAEYVQSANDYARNPIKFDFKEKGNMLKYGGQTKPKFEDWYKTVPAEINDTTNYNLRRAYELLPFNELEDWRNGKAHLRSIVPTSNGDYEFLKSKKHPTYNKEIEWFNSNDKNAIEFRNNYRLDNKDKYPKYIKKSKMGKLVSINGNVKNGLIHTPNQDVLAYNKERKPRFNGRYSKPGLHNLELLAADLLLPKGKVNIEPDVPKRLGWVEAHNRLVSADISQKPLDAKKDNTNVVHTISETERRTRKFVCGGRSKAKTGTKKDNVIDEIVINAARPKLSAYSVLKDNDTSNRHSKKVIEREVYQADALSSDRLKTKIDNTPYKEKEIDTSYGDRIVTPLINSKSVTKAERNTNIRGRINNEYNSVEELLNRVRELGTDAQDKSNKDYIPYSSPVDNYGEKTFRNNITLDRLNRFGITPHTYGNGERTISNTSINNNQDIIESINNETPRKGTNQSSSSSTGGINNRTTKPAKSAVQRVNKLAPATNAEMAGIRRGLEPLLQNTIVDKLNKTVDNDLNVMPVQDDVAKTRNMDNILLGVNLGSSVLDAVMGNIYANQMHGYTAPNITAPTIKNPGEVKLNEEDLKDIPAPILMAAAKLKTRYNANPQLSKIEDDTRRIMGEIGRNTSNSRVALARKQRAALQGQQAKNEVYGRKENIETELINKDKLNQQEVTARNLARYDQYNQALAAQRANRARLRLAADTANIQNKLAVSTANAQLKSQADRFNTANKINQLVHQAGIDAAKAEARSNIFSGMLGNIGSALNTWNRNKRQAKLDEETLRVLGLLAPNANKLVLSALGY